VEILELGGYCDGTVRLDKSMEEMASGKVKSGCVKIDAIPIRLNWIEIPPLYSVRVFNCCYNYSCDFLTNPKVLIRVLKV